MLIHKCVWLNVFLMLAFFHLIPTHVLGAEESVTVTTYYPSPYGVYSEMRLYPKLEAEATACNSSNQEGLMFYDRTMHALRVCRCASGGGCVLSGEFDYTSANYWMLSDAETELYPNNPAWNVGIGTTGPTAKLEIAGGHLRVSGGNQAQFIESSGVQGSAIFETLVSSQGVLNIGNTAGTPHFSVNTNNGRVGIGTTTMMGFLSIARSAYVNDAYISFDTRVGVDGTVKRWGEVSAAQQTDITDNINGGGMTDNSARNGWGISFGDNLDAFQVRRVRATGGVGANGVLFAVANSGNVGIGTTSPQAKLDVAGGVRIGADTAGCVASKSGTMRYNSGNIEYCDGANWMIVGATTPVSTGIYGWCVSSGSALLPATFTSGSCACPSGYQRVSVGMSAFGAYYYQCYRN